MFIFTPRSEEELVKFGLIEPGTYTFEVIGADDSKPSKKGNQMLTLQLKIWDRDGSERHLYDFLLPDVPMMEFKIKHFCESIGKSNDYNSGSLNTESIVGLTGKLVIYTQKSKDGLYPDKSAVKDYLPKEINSQNKNSLDDIPF